VPPDRPAGSEGPPQQGTRLPPEAGVVDRSLYPEVIVGEGYALGNINEMGSEYGFRKVRKALGVTAFGVNALVRAPGYETKWHYHDVQEELYFVHRGSIEMQFGDGTTHLLGEGMFARVDASTTRKIRVLGPGDTIYLCVGGEGGYIGRDGRTPEP